MSYPRGLVKYTTENALQGKPTKLVRPRILVYVSILTFISVGAGVRPADPYPA